MRRRWPQIHFRCFIYGKPLGPARTTERAQAPALYGGIRTFTAVRGAEMFMVFKGGLERSSIAALVSPVMGSEAEDHSWDL